MRLYYHTTDHRLLDSITKNESISLVQFLESFFGRLKRLILSAGFFLGFSEVAAGGGMVAAAFGDFAEGDQ